MVKFSVYLNRHDFVMTIKGNKLLPLGSNVFFLEKTIFFSEGVRCTETQTGSHKNGIHKMHRYIWPLSAHYCKIFFRGIFF